MRDYACRSTKPEGPAQILIVDDHPLVNLGLAAIIGDEEGLSICGQATSVADAARLFELTRPDLVVLDILLPDGNGLDFLAELLRADPTTKVLVFSSVDPEFYAAKAKSLGAIGFVHKSMVVEEIVPAIRRALAEPSR